MHNSNKIFCRRLVNLGRAGMRIKFITLYGLRGSWMKLFSRAEGGVRALRWPGYATETTPTTALSWTQGHIVIQVLTGHQKPTNNPIKLSKMQLPHSHSATPPTQQLTSFPVWAGQHHLLIAIDKVAHTSHAHLLWPAYIAV